MKQINFSLLLLLIFTYCNGQNKPGSSKDSISNLKTISTGQPKIIKTKGTGKYAAVRCGLQDKAGNLWFGTTGEGIYRYDGKVFVNFTEKDGLNSNYINAVLEDKSGNIWFGTNGGICRYNGKKITNIPFSVGNSGNIYPFSAKTLTSSQTQVWSMVQDRTGKLWFGTSDDGVYCYDGKSFVHFLHDDSVINKSGIRLRAITSMIEDKAGNIWFTSWFDGICRFDGKSMTSFKPNGEVWFGTVFEDRAGNIWVGRRDSGVCRYDGKTFANVSDKGLFDSCGIFAITEDKSGNIWFGAEFNDMTKRETMGGVWRYNPSLTGSKAFTNFTTRDGLSNDAVFSIIIDKAGTFWFGTRGMGLCSYDGKQFTNFIAKD